MKTTVAKVLRDAYKELGESLNAEIKYDEIEGFATISVPFGGIIVIPLNTPNPKPLAFDYPDEFIILNGALIHRDKAYTSTGKVIQLPSPRNWHHIETDEEGIAIYLNNPKSPCDLIEIRYDTKTGKRIE